MGRGFLKRLIQENGWKYLVFFLLFFCIGSMLQIDFANRTEQQYALSTGQLYLLLWYGREPILDYTSKDALRIPGLWFWIHSVWYVLQLRCLNRSSEYPYTWIVAGGSRVRIWNQILAGYVWHAGAYSVSLLLAFGCAGALRGGRPIVPGGAKVLSELSGVYQGLGSIAPEEMTFGFWLHVVLLPGLVCMTLSILQETLERFVHIAISMILSFGYLFLANFIFHVSLIGNATMLARSEFAGYPADWPKTVAICSLLCMVCYIVGRWKLQKADLMEMV